MARTWPQGLTSPRKEVTLPKGLFGVAIAVCWVGLLVACLAPPFGPPPQLRSVQPTPVPSSDPWRLTNRSQPFSPLVTGSGPHFMQVTTSRKVFVKSDCVGTSISVTATITAAAGIAQVMLWYRVGDQQPFTPVVVAPVGDDQYAVTVKGTSVPGSDYGVWAFYLTADD